MAPEKVARSVGAAPTTLSFGGSAAQAGALRIEIGSPGWVFTSNELDSKSSASDNSATGQLNAECRMKSTESGVRKGRDLASRFCTPKSASEFKLVSRPGNAPSSVD